jgi:hypothetical protein
MTIAELVKQQERHEKRVEFLLFIIGEALVHLLFYNSNKTLRPIDAQTKALGLLKDLRDIQAEMIKEAEQ